MKKTATEIGDITNKWVLSSVVLFTLHDGKEPERQVQSLGANEPLVPKKSLLCKMNFTLVSRDGSQKPK